MVEHLWLLPCPRSVWYSIFLNIQKIHPLYERFICRRWNLGSGHSTFGSCASMEGTRIRCFFFLGGNTARTRTRSGGKGRNPFFPNYCGTTAALSFFGMGKATLCFFASLKAIMVFDFKSETRCNRGGRRVHVSSHCVCGVDARYPELDSSNGWGTAFIQSSFGAICHAHYRDMARYGLCISCFQNCCTWKSCTCGYTGRIFRKSERDFFFGFIF